MTGRSRRQLGGDLHAPHSGLTLPRVENSATMVINSTPVSLARESVAIDRNLMQVVVTIVQIALGSW